MVKSKCQKFFKPFSRKQRKSTYNTAEQHLTVLASHCRLLSKTQREVNNMFVFDTVCIIMNAFSMCIPIGPVAQYPIRGIDVDRYMVPIVIPEGCKVLSHRIPCKWKSRTVGIKIFCQNVVAEKTMFGSIECLYLWNKEGFHGVVIHHWRRQDVACQLTTSRLFDDKLLSHSQWPQYHMGRVTRKGP